ncbi:MAG TPA: LPS assembly protein LptD [Bryobacteraceae bacterium]|nr:LPS assembly protein LptD [Bryobacteraceae bacterium]
MFALRLPAQPAYTPEFAGPAPATQPSANLNARVIPARPGAPGPEEYLIRAINQEQDGPWIHLRGAALVETTDMQLKADQIDYNRDTGYAEARGNVHFENFARGEKLNCDRAEYNVEEHTGKFYNVTGSATTRIVARPGRLTTQNPFYFAGEWAERLSDRYILHHGFLTDCLVPAPPTTPWWTMHAPAIDVIPGERAITHNAWLHIRSVRLFYFPFFYKALDKEPRRSGFLMPNIGNSSTRGQIIGMSYFWAINRSYDLTYNVDFFSKVGLAHHADFRGKVSPTTDFDALIFTVPTTPSTAINGITPTAGVTMTVNAKTQLGNGWEGRGVLDYLSSFAFRQQFTESFSEAVFSETHSVGFLDKHWADYGINVVAQRIVNFQSAAPGNEISLRKLPEVEFLEREHQLGDLPFWFSLDSSYGLERRSQPLFQTRQFVSRADFAPHVMTAFNFLGVHIAPSFGIRETFYDSSLTPESTPTAPSVNGENLLRSSRDVSVDLAFPSLERIFNTPARFEKYGLGKKVKHVIEPRATYHYVTGIDDFARTVRFDQLDLLSNTNEVDFSLVNRLLAKDSNGTVTDLLTWQVWYARYFDPTFGGAVVPGIRNVLASSLDLTGFAFIDGLRHQSPIVSSFRVQSRVGVEWRADWDPVRHALVNSGATLDIRSGFKFFSIGHYDVKSDPILTPSANQLRVLVGYGNDTRKGWNYGASVFYDYRQSLLQYTQAQVTYNTDCCGLSVQFRRIEIINARNENQFRVAFALSNIGTFGTLKRQEKIF